MANTPGPSAASMPLQPMGGHKPTGYPALASVMGPFGRMGMYKRFAALNAYNLLMRQAELIHLETRLRATIEGDKDAGLHLHESVHAMLKAADEGGVDAEQWELVLEIRGKLEEYNAAVLQQAEMLALPRPRKYDRSVLREWLGRPAGGNNFLGPDENRPWLESEQEDLVSLSRNGYDSLTHLIEERVVPWAVQSRIFPQKTASGHEATGLQEWRQPSFEVISRTLCVLMSTLVPSLAIVALYTLDNMRQRILTASLLTFAFSAALALMTSARPPELFVATAAFAAVQVVFIGSTNMQCS